MTAASDVRADRQDQASPLRVVGGTAATKILVMGVSGLLGIISSRLIISHFGVPAYAQYGLLATLPGLMPFADLGISAAVLNAISGSRSPRTDPAVRSSLTSALRVMCVSGLLIAVVGVVIGLLGWWPTLLGEGLLPDGGIAASLCLVLFGLGLPLTVGSRILVGLGRNPAQIATQAVIAPFIVASVTVVVVLGIPFGNYLALLSYLGTILMASICVVLGGRLLRPQLGRAVRDVPRLRSVPSVRVMDVAWPMLVQMLALPVAMQTDRLLLSHLAGPTEMATYALSAQLFGMVLQTIAAAGLALWPIFARARSEGEVRSPFVLVRWFLIGGLTLGTVLALLLPFVVGVISDGAITVGPVLAITFVAFVAVQAAKYPLGMYMTDLAGLRFQVIPILIMVPLNLGLSWVLVDPLGAAGPVVGSTVAVLLCQVLPCVHYVRRDLRRRLSAPDPDPEHEESR